MNPILARFDNQPAFIAEHMSTWLEVSSVEAAKLLSRIDQHAAENTLVASSEDFWLSPEDWRSAYRPYIVKNGILRIPVRGVLLNKMPWQLGGWATGYEYIKQAVKRGIADTEVKGIALEVDSGGGLVAGNLELVDYVYESRGAKPIKAYANDSAYSAAYSIASAADDITVTRSGGVGSIGVVATHIEVSERLKMQGLKVTFIFAGKHKVDGNPYEALPKGVQAKIQSRVDASYTEFVGTVARNRELSDEAVRATEAEMFSATEALSVGLADKIGGPIDEEITAFGAIFTQDEEDEDMAFTQADFDAVEAKSRSEGEATGAASERARISAILGSDAAKSRPAAAMLMVTLGVDTEKAVAELAKLPEEAKAAAPVVADAAAGDAALAAAGAGAPKGMLDAAMKGSKHDDLATGGDADDGEKDEAAADEALLLAAGMPGFKVKQK